MTGALRLAAGVDPTSHAETWVRSEALAELVTAFGGVPPREDEPLSAALERLDDFSSVWDFRRGKERNEVGATGLTAEQEAAVAAAVGPLGQRDTDPPARSGWDIIIVLGGLLRACLSRPAATASLLGSGAIVAERVVGLGALRPINDAERALAAQVPELVGPEQRIFDELDAMTIGFRRAFALSGVFIEQGERQPAIEQSWRVLTYGDARTPTHQLIAAAAPEAGRRTTTMQALAWYADFAKITAGTSVLLVTTEIYRHYHLVDAIRTLGLTRGAVVDCVGMSPGDTDPRLAVEFSWQSRVQEVRSSIRALRALVSDASTPVLQPGSDPPSR